MSGHSKWAQIKHQKGATDARRGQLFSKLTRRVTLAAKDGSDPNTNSKLRLAIDKAKEANMPWGNIERTMKKGMGELTGEVIEEILYEAYGPGGAAILVQAITDNKNRTSQEIKHILGKFGGKLAEPKSVQFLFERTGVITILLPQNKTKEDIELAAIDCGAKDIITSNPLIHIYTQPGNVETLKNHLLNQGVNVKETGIDFIPSDTLQLDETSKNRLLELFSALDNHDDVQEIYSNVKIEDENE